MSGVFNQVALMEEVFSLAEGGVGDLRVNWVVRYRHSGRYKFIYHTNIL